MRVALIDLSNFIYKFKHTIKKKVKVNGVVTDISPLIGVERTLKFMKDFDRVIFCIDGYPRVS